MKRLLVFPLVSLVLGLPGLAHAACHGGKNMMESMLGTGLNENAIARTNYTFCVDIGASPSLASRIAQGDAFGDSLKQSTGAVIRAAYTRAQRYSAVQPASSSGTIGIRFIIVNPVDNPPQNQTTESARVVGVDCPDQPSGGTGQNGPRYRCVQLSTDATAADIDAFFASESTVSKRSWAAWATGFGSGLPVYLTDGATKGLLPTDLTAGAENAVTAGSAH